jgi:hypothetical protein
MPFGVWMIADYQVALLPPRSIDPLRTRLIRQTLRTSGTHSPANEDLFEIRPP